MPDTYPPTRQREALWHVCLVCGLGGPIAGPGLHYCRQHRPADHPPDPPPPDNLTAIEKALGRRVLRTPPDLHALIRAHGGYAKITAEGWAKYDAALADWKRNQREPEQEGEASEAQIAARAAFADRARTKAEETRATDARHPQDAAGRTDTALEPAAARNPRSNPGTDAPAAIPVASEGEA